MLGPGKYDDICTEAREKANASGVLIVILEGNKGNGFSCQLPLEAMVTLPQMLRDIANQIESSGNEGTHDRDQGDGESDSFDVSRN